MVKSQMTTPSSPAFPAPFVGSKTATAPIRFPRRSALTDDARGGRTSCGCNPWGWGSHPGDGKKAMENSRGSLVNHHVSLFFPWKMDEKMVCLETSLKVAYKHTYGVAVRDAKL